MDKVVKLTDHSFDFLADRQTPAGVIDITPLCPTAKSNNQRVVVRFAYKKPCGETIFQIGIVNNQTSKITWSRIFNLFLGKFDLRLLNPQDINFINQSLGINLEVLSQIIKQYAPKPK
jgi:hypothetical protein